MAFTVLSDNNVKQLFQGFGPEDVALMSDVLTDAFLSYSVGPEAQYQPHRAAVVRPDGTTGLFMPATMEGGMSVKIVGLPPPNSATTDLRCVLTICDGTGKAATANIVVFGAGKQALWHLRLALVLRGKDIKTITIAMSKASGVGNTDSVTFTVTEATPDSAPGNAELRSAVEESDVIFCTTPSTQRIFPAEWLTSERGSAKARYISAIGSYKLNMKELDPEFLRAVVDTPLGAFTSAGGGAKKDGIPAEKIVEVGEFTDKLRKADEGEAGLLREWLEKGLIVYKSVGIGIMDLSLGKVILELAAKHKVGTILPEF
ncbi:shikimate/quinate 5-dehydrogenase [Colletotrichum scovillei]|uniref:shikimate/quinate 5-dehydrogenase n=1 Tax=Colletotrichum scovillei TaxID=1209932 RepID=UPI0015C2D920|nr:shikimate/quinate 5-dehydrogenase [Colletotrichum scovillei]KAF4782528.1 shikimate/quinate 5-dehydrogenase [Colletotrichum scovillei]